MTEPGIGYRIADDTRYSVGKIDRPR
jgi:hypothetical protein